MSAIKLAIAGSGGRMGKMLIEAVLQAPDMQLAAALEHASSPFLGRDAGEGLGIQSGVRITSDIATSLEGVDCLIDFTRPEGTLEHLTVCRRLGVHLVIGTTGFSAQQKTIIEAASREIPIVFAPNMAV